MSLIRALSKELEARSDDSLRALFAARPDLMSPAVPDFSALAARASARVSVQRALERLNRPQMQVLETLHLCTNTDTEHSASAAGVRKLIAGSTVAALERILASLQELALVHRAEPPHGMAVSGQRQRYYLPVGSLKDVVGIYPAGLGRSYTELVRLQPAFAQRVVQLVAELHRSGVSIQNATTPMEAALALQHWTSSPEALSEALADAPERTTALLAKFRNWAMGAVPQAQRKASVSNQGADVGPVDWLLARGLLVPLDAAHVELPHSVGLSLRGGAIINDFSLSPPVPELGSTTAALRRNAALGAIAETLRLVGDLLHAVREQPLATLRSGGVGVREMKRLAETLRIDQHRAGLLLELSALSGLLRLDVDSSSWVQPPQLEWLALPRQEQWLWLVNAWLASERVPSLVGQPVNGPGGVPAAHRALAGNTVNALSAEAQRPDAPVVRKRILEILEELTQEAAAADGTAPVLDAAAVLQRAEWTQPRMARRFSSLIRGVLAEAELLGLTGSGALSQLGSAIAEDNPDEALGILGEHLPAALNHVLLQADLTAVAPGYLAPELAEKLLVMADAEGQGPATIYRFSASSVRRALDAGHDASSLLEFLREHSATAVPQPLEYLVEDTASRHGRLRVGTAASFIQSDDEATVLELAAESKAAGLGLARIAPTVLISTAPPRETAQVLRGLGLSPSVDQAEPGVVRLRRTNSVPGSARPVYTAPRTAPAEDDVAAQLAVLRNRRAEAAGNHAGAVPGSGEAATQLGLETLQRAIRLKQRVSMNVVDSQGNSCLETVVPLSVNGGRVRVFDPAKETERVLSIHRIIDIEAAEELRQ
ncbi:helicase-associated domain-containing protein [Pseudarthrobacter cellobiosi]|uniref:helicase-associated domain-containing protein n=1 Tax=Pseudarthrobacter cellobiosi TaxID=2953654 RepID=UPI00208EFCDD|nr:MULTISPECIES: helicase-associated domain-containing protein [unclassified Pseudarthrobacter]MCO4254986.1 helicase-associated domain-containing protein [Pseudarthrobacter sp. HLT1-5]MCO4273218.1 helicase-associated domain-containing protein [Pseudarthrobacter sp. HLT3-5]